MFRVFVRDWWIENPSWPNGLEPCAGERTYFDEEFDTGPEAREFCKEYNEEHDPGRYSRKAEYEEE